MKKTKIFNLIGIGLMGILLILHFIPFWSYDGMSTSIQAYVWLPTDYPQLEEYFVSHVDLGNSYVANQVVLMPILVLFLAVAGIILCIWKADNIYASLIPLTCGIVGAWGYLAKPVFQLGINWGLHLAVCIVMIVVAIMRLVFEIKKE